MKNNKWILVFLAGMFLAVLGLPVSAIENPADSDRVFLHVFIPGERGQLKLFRLPPAVSLEQCRINRDEVRQGSHSRAVRFCSRYVEHVGSKLTRFSVIQDSADD